ncbi:PAB-dependent poly(A)-specific ribonuclease [Heracleum sosnowskyi]|uniref:PAB-dependent poly(A)-specific ribonuclease n=1 Tax=Heracleum sosnowskyi TaxID=360622 RepID=A0AAD8ITY4_9APIA|nr:PAB-dependent poly(A)-specific ribonuclease [Heracleum sosnowskyi]
MDQHPVEERDFGVDLEAGDTTSDQTEPADNVSAANSERNFFNKLCRGSVSVDAPGKAGNGVSLGSLNGGVTSPGEVKVLVDEKVQAEEVVGLKENNMGKEKRKTQSAKKPPKPPRPPRGLSLDAYDQKLIKEIAQVAMMKRARIERIKALKKIKAAKASSSSSGNLFAMLFTIVFCLVVLFQGVSSRCSENSFPGSPESANIVDDGSLMNGNYWNSSTIGGNVLSLVSPNPAE